MKCPKSCWDRLLYKKMLKIKNREPSYVIIMVHHTGIDRWAIRTGIRRRTFNIAYRTVATRCNQDATSESQFRPFMFSTYHKTENSSCIPLKEQTNIIMSSNTKSTKATTKQDDSMKGTSTTDTSIKKKKDKSTKKTSEKGEKQQGGDPPSTKSKKEKAGGKKKKGDTTDLKMQELQQVETRPRGRNAVQPAPLRYEPPVDLHEALQRARAIIRANLYSQQLPIFMAEVLEEERTRDPSFTMEQLNSQDYYLDGFGRADFYDFCAIKFAEENMLFYRQFQVLDELVTRPIQRSQFDEYGAIYLRFVKEGLWAKFIKPGSPYQVNLPDEVVKKIKKLLPK
jgi:hypothetical protein